MNTFKEKLGKTDMTDREAVAECVRLFDSLTEYEKASVSFGDYVKLTEAEYKTENAEKLADAGKHIPEIIAAVAKAYFDRSYMTWKTPDAKPYALYDQYNSRRNFNAAPEDASSQKNLYLDCSSFINSVYHYCFGQNLCSGGKRVSTKNINTEMASEPSGADLELMYYLTGDEIETLKADKEKAAALIAEIKGALRPGDVINYYRSTDTGHVVMYIGDGKIIHSTGSANAKTSNGNTDPKTSVERGTADENRFGTINIDSWDKFFTTTATAKSSGDGRTSTSNSYLFSEKIAHVAIFRPTNEKNGRFRGEKIRDEAVTRYLYPGLFIEKTAEVLRAGGKKTLLCGNSVYAGDVISFTVTVRNTSLSAMKALSITEIIPPECEYVSSSAGSVYFSAEKTAALHRAELPSGGEITFEYSLRVKSSAQGGSIISDTGTYVNGLRTNKTVFQVAAMKNDRAGLKKGIELTEGRQYGDAISAITDIYGYLPEGGFGCVGRLGSAEKIIGSFFEDNMLKTDFPDGKAAVCTLYGGYKVGSAEVSAAIRSGDYDSMNLRARRVMEAYLEDGDIIVTYSEYLKEYSCRMYFDGNIFGIAEDGTFRKLDPSTLSVNGTVQDYLDTLTAYNCFVILRPALIG